MRLSRRHAWLALVCTPLLASSLAHAWPGYTWQQWRAVSTCSKPDLRTPQSGRQDLLPLIGAAPGQEAITTVAAWERKRQRILAVLARLLGEPAKLQAPTPEVRVVGETVLPDYIRRHVLIRSEPDSVSGGDWIPAYVLVPREPASNTSPKRARGRIPETSSAATATAYQLVAKVVARASSPCFHGQDAGATAGHRRPAVICLHQTATQGKGEPAGLGGNPDLALAVELVRRGFVCIAPDVIGFGDRIPAGTQPYNGIMAFFRRHPGWSVMGKMVWDVSRVVDYLEMLPEVDAGRIGCIGHSHGAYGTIFAAAFEPRIRVAAASCGFTPLRVDTRPDRWSELTPLIPQLGMYLRAPQTRCSASGDPPDVASIPTDWQEICAVIAPRPLFVWYSTNDSCFPNTAILQDVLSDVRNVYALYGAAGNVKWAATDGPHGFPRQGRELAYAWLEKHLDAQ